MYFKKWRGFALAAGSFVWFSWLACWQASPALGAEPPGTLSLEEVLRLAAEHDPAVQASAWRARAAREAAEDAGKRPNPEFAAEVEELGGDLGSDRFELTLGLQQTFELGGDRGARGDAARSEARAAHHAFESERLRRVGLAAERFLDAWMWQERVERLEEAEGLARQIVEAAADRFRQGATPRVDRIRAEGNLALLVSEKLRSEARLDAERRDLAWRLGAGTTILDTLQLADPPFTRPAAAESLATRLAEHPERRRLDETIEAAAARARLARAARVPDLTLGASFRRLEETDAHTFLFGLSAPLPLWNAGGGRARSAEAELAAARSIEQGVRLEQEAALHRAVGRLRAALSANEAISEGYAPALREALDEVQEGYRAGRFTFLDLLEAQRSALEAEISLLETKREIWSARLELTRLLGGVSIDSTDLGGDR